MSRLFDGLARLDRGRARPAELGGIALPLPRAGGRRTWRIVGYFIILGGMAAIAWTVFVRPPARDFLASAAPRQIAPLPPTLSVTPAVPSPLAQGLEAAQRGALADAERLFRDALARDAGDVEAWNSLGVVLIRQGDRERGVDALRTALGLQPTHAEAHRNLGAALDRRGLRDEAVRHYEAFLSLSPPDHPGRDEVRRRLLELAPERAPA
jgi:cytochrome c-type biogenesis protein CcmH/NrfG